MYASDEAARLGLTGWVRNLRDGVVEIVAEGEEDALAEFLEWCRCGSPYARVVRVREEYSDATDKFDSFRIAY